MLCGTRYILAIALFGAVLCTAWTGSLGVKRIGVAPPQTRLAFKMSTSYHNYNPPRYLTTVADKTLGSGVTEADVVLASGSSPSTVRSDLLRFAHVVSARMRVTSSGELVYDIPERYRSMLLKRSISFRMVTLWRKLWPYAFGALKCAFGAVLFISLAIFAAVVSSSAADNSNKSDERRKKQQGGNGGWDRNERSRARVAIDVVDLARIAARCTGGSPRGGEHGSEGPQWVSFLESFFSFVFGDGDPNEGFEDALSQAAAAEIHRRGGTVLAEELYPYLAQPPSPPPTSDHGDGALAESSVLPILLRFGGEAQVSSSGNIFYAFPELMSTAEAKPAAALGPSQPLEQAHTFSRASAGQQALAAGLGVLNLLGVAAVGQTARWGARTPSAALAARVFPVLLVYALIYSVTPVLRALRIRAANASIERRNQARQAWLSRLKTDGALLAKQRDRASLRQSQMAQSDDVIVYDTGQDGC